MQPDISFKVVILTLMEGYSWADINIELSMAIKC